PRVRHPTAGLYPDAPPGLGNSCLGIREPPASRAKYTQTHAPDTGRTIRRLPQMLSWRSPAGLLACAAGLLAGPARAADPPPDPLRLIPAQGTDLVLKVERPRDLAGAFTPPPALKQFLQFEAVRDALATASVRRFFQLVAYAERELGAPWPELLDQTAGGGIVLAVQLAGNPKDNKLLVAVQAKDEKQL